MIIQEISDAPNSTSTDYFLPLGGTFVGSISDDDREDWFRITLEANQGYEVFISLVGQNGHSALQNPAFRIYDVNGTPITGIVDRDVTGPENAIIPVAETGTYFIEVLDGSSLFRGGDYRFSITTDVSADWYSPAVVTTDVPYEGTIVTRDDVDWVQLDVTAGYSYRVSVQGVGNDALRWIGLVALQVNDFGDPTPLGNDDNNADDSVELTLNAAVSGSAFFAVSSFSNRDTGDYRISVVEEVGFGATSQARATLAEVYESELHSLDRDWIGVELEEGRTYTIDVLGEGSGLFEGLRDMSVELYDAQGREIDAARYGGAGLDPQLTFTPSTSGLFFVEPTHTGAGRYGILVTESDAQNGSAADDRLDGDAQSNRLFGGAGNDLLRGFEQNDTLFGGAGQDTLQGNDGNDVLIGGTSQADLRDVIFGGEGNDSAQGGYGNDELRGDAGNDTLEGGFGADTVIGGVGDDLLTAGAWGDVLFGGDGMDFINGGFGFDRVNGGAGADRFYH